MMSNLKLAAVLSVVIAILLVILCYLMSRYDIVAQILGLLIGIPFLAIVTFNMITGGSLHGGYRD
jgi:hypothetical protein